MNEFESNKEEFEACRDEQWDKIKVLRKAHKWTDGADWAFELLYPRVLDNYHAAKEHREFADHLKEKYRKLERENAELKNILLEGKETLSMAGRILNSAEVRHINSGKDVPTRLYADARNTLQTMVNNFKTKLIKVGIVLNGQGE